jgi:para-nitrobenzyl esterase
MQRAWTLFARTGVTGWPRYDEHTRFTQIWDSHSHLAYKPAEDERAAWDSYNFPALTLNV